MYKVIRPFRDDDSGKNWSRGVVASAADFGGNAAVDRLISSGHLAAYSENDSPAVSGQVDLDEKALRIANLEAENKRLRAQLAELEAPRPHLFEGINGIGSEIAIALENAGFNSIEELRDADDERLLAVAGIGRALLKKIREHFKAKGEE